MTPTVKLSLPLAEAIRQILLRQFLTAQTLLEKMQTADEITADDVHDLRVALRRAVALCGHAAPWLDQGWLDKRSRVCRALLRLLGRVRDRDIVAGLAAAFFGEASDSAGGNLAARLAESSRRRRLSLPRKLADRAALKKINREVAALADPAAGLYLAPVAVSDKGVVRLYRLADCLPAMLYRSVAALTTYRAILPPDAQAVDRVVLHRLRIVAKELRYLLEMADLLPGAPFAALIQAFKRLQDILGDWHDGLLVRDLLADQADCPDESAAVSSWIVSLDEREDGLKKAFAEIWHEATPEWFHTHLAAALSSLYESDLGAGCACCAKSEACAAGPSDADPVPGS